MEHKFFGISCMISHIITKNRGKCIEGEMISYGYIWAISWGIPDLHCPLTWIDYLKTNKAKNGEHFMSNVDDKNI